MSGRIRFEFESGRQSVPASRQAGVRRILILADCLGQRERAARLADRKILPVGVDDFDAALDGMSPQLRFLLDDAPDTEVRIDIRQMDDFHPDTLFGRMPIFRALREMRGRLENPATFAAAAEELERGTNSLASPRQPARSEAPGAEGAEGSLFEHLLGKQPAERSPAPFPRQDAVQRLIRQIAVPHLAKGADPGEQRLWLSVIDDAIAQTMRRILHHPAFQRLESVWRGIHWLITRIEDSEAPNIFLLDASEAELAADLAAAGSRLEGTALNRLLTDSSVAIAGGEPWSLVIGDYAFGAGVDSLDLLEFLGAVSAGCGGIFVGAAHSALLGCASLAAAPDASGWMQPDAELAERWQRLRLGPPARHIGLALPRFMLRLPYGEKSDAIERFRFEEMPSHPPHDAYLWGNPAYACGLLVADAWTKGDVRATATLREIGDLPYDVHDDGGEKVMKPCAEAYLNEKTANAILGQGIMPLLSVRQRNCVLVPRLQSISRPPLDLP